MQSAERGSREIACELSYSWSIKTRPGKMVVRTLETIGGRLELIRRAKGYEQDVALGACFWSVMAERYGLTLDVIRGSLENIPTTGPVLLVANHPYGILDGLMMGHILSTRRGDFRILANDVFRKAEDLNKVILPIDFAGTKEAMAANLHTRKQALGYLTQGGAIGIFPGGTVSTSQKPFSQPFDPGWRNFTARMVAKSNATVVPVYFEGHNSRLFQIASHLHYTLRMGLLIREFKKRVDTPVRVTIGDPIGRDQLDPLASDAKSLMDFLRNKTYQLSSETKGIPPLGYEFE